MSEIKNGGPFEQQQFGTAGVEGVKLHLLFYLFDIQTGVDLESQKGPYAAISFNWETMHEVKHCNQLEVSLNSFPTSTHLPDSLYAFTPLTFLMSLEILQSSHKYNKCTSPRCLNALELVWIGLCGKLTTCAGPFARRNGAIVLWRVVGLWLS